MLKSNSKILITGAAGFIGSHVIKRFNSCNLILTDHIAGIVSGSLHEARCKEVSDAHPIYACDITNFEEVRQLLQTQQPDLIIHLAAKTGITESALNPRSYYNTNVNGFYNLLENARRLGINNIIYASSSSVYSLDVSGIFHENSDTLTQASFYGTTKKANENLAASYSALFGMNCIGLRFFTVYGSWVREDMAAYKFMSALTNGLPLTLYNRGEVARDFTHVSDVAESIYRISTRLREHSALGQKIIYNIGHGNPITISSYLSALEQHLNLKAEIVYKTLPPNELSHTHASTKKLEEWIGFKPQTGLQQGVKEMCDWFLAYNLKPKKTA